MEERRRSNRFAVAHAVSVDLPTTQSVQVLDISVMGVLLHSSRLIVPGTRGSLKLNFWGTTFSADVEFRRTVAAGNENGAGYRVGATFIGITPEHRQLIERFASQ